MVRPLISFKAPYGTNYYDSKRAQSDAIRVISVGSNSGYKGKTDKMPDYPGGIGGTVTIVNNAPITNAPGAGIYAVSAGGSPYDNADGGAGGAVTVTTTDDITAEGFGIVAISRGRRQQHPDRRHWRHCGRRCQRRRRFHCLDLRRRRRFRRVLRRQQPKEKRWRRHRGGGGDVTLTVGSSSTPFGGSITTAAPGSVGKDWGFRDRTTGAALSAISYGGQGLVTTSGSGVGFNGGDGGAVTVRVFGTSHTLLKTSGNDSFGIMAVSYGGTSQDQYDASKSGGAASTAMVALSGRGAIETAGNHSTGIVAGSLGGLGKLSSSAETNGAGKGGVAGNVSVSNDFSITTQGYHSHGIAAISAGAGGGIFVWPGRSAFQWGDGNPASNTSGTVEVANTGAIRTHGADAHGIVAQSIGGGGGLLSSTATLPTDTNGVVSSDATNQTIGGTSGGADAAEVSVTNHGAITTYGGYAKGGQVPSGADAVALGGGIAILAQSIGGGGGNNSGQGALGTIGGTGSSGGDGADGGVVLIKNFGALTTYGSEAHGIVAQSIGGGGGGRPPAPPRWSRRRRRGASARTSRASPRGRRRRPGRWTARRRRCPRWWRCRRRACSRRSAGRARPRRRRRLRDGLSGGARTGVFREGPGNRIRVGGSASRSMAARRS